MTTHRVWASGEWREVDVPSMRGEALVVPNVAGVVRRPDGAILLQRRDKPGEEVRGLLEIPAGRWRAGEPAEDAVRREVREETGLDVEVVGAVASRLEAHEHRPIESLAPVATVAGVDGAYPALILAFACRGDGVPRACPGETSDPAWYSEQEVRAMLETPALFTGFAALVLKTVLG